VVINDLPECLSGVEASLVVDDCAIYKSAAKQQLDSMVELIERNLDADERGCIGWGFKTSAEKTVGVLFANDDRLKTQMKPVIINDKPINIGPAVKFLGVSFDQRLSWHHHFDHVVNKCKPRLNLMKSGAGSNWGTSKSGSLLIYRSLIRFMVVTISLFSVVYS